MPDPKSDLERIAAEIAAATLLIAPLDHPLGERLPAVCELRHTTAESLLAQPQDDPRRRLGLVADTLERLPPSLAETLLARLRDRLVETLYCLADPGQWPAERMLALGLRPLGTYPRAGGGQALYYFDLYDYKRTPDWLNPRHWANPQRWDKHRW